MTINSNAASGFVDTNFVRVLRRMRADQVSELVDAGALLWVFDISARLPGQHALRQLRFWLPEVVTPQLTARLELEEVIVRLLPASRTYFRGGEVAQMLLIAPPQLSRLAAQWSGQLKGAHYRIPRQPLAEWLANRWLGGVETSKCFQQGKRGFR